MFIVIEEDSIIIHELMKGEKVLRVKRIQLKFFIVIQTQTRLD